MKKLLILAGVIALTSSVQTFAQEESALPQGKPCPVEQCQRPDVMPPCKMQRPPHFDMQKFENELKLTNKQKEQLKQLREKELEASKPIFEELKNKEKEVWELRHQLREIRVQNKKEFEAILTDKQLKKLEAIKTEHKKEFAKRHPNGMHKRPPMPCPIEGKCPQAIPEKE